MSNLTKKDLRDIVKNILFENSIKEMFPDGFTSSRTTMFDTTGSKLNGDQKELDLELNTPLTADDFVSVSMLKKNHNVRDKNYVPKSVELSSAMISILDDNKDISDDLAEKIWKSATQIINKGQK
jgi:hypothetical protein